MKRKYFKVASAHFYASAAVAFTSFCWNISSFPFWKNPVLMLCVVWYGVEVLEHIHTNTQKTIHLH